MLTAIDWMFRGWAAEPTQDFIEERAPSFFSKDQYPGNSPDFNIVENKLSELKSRVHARRPKNRAELCTAIDEIWSEITTKENVKPLYESMPRRLQECINLKGGMTRY